MMSFDEPINKFSSTILRQLINTKPKSKERQRGYQILSKRTKKTVQLICLLNMRFHSGCLYTVQIYRYMYIDFQN